MPEYGFKTGDVVRVIADGIICKVIGVTGNGRLMVRESYPEFSGASYTINPSDVAKVATYGEQKFG